MTKKSNPNAPSSSLIYVAKTEADKTLVKNVKQLALQDNIDQRDLVAEGLKLMLRAHNFPPGNPQLPLSKFTEKLEVDKKPVPKSHTLKVIDYEGMTDEQLQNSYIIAVRCGNVVKYSMAAFYLKKRGLYEETKKRARHER